MLQFACDANEILCFNFIISTEIYIQIKAHLVIRNCATIDAFELAMDITTNEESDAHSGYLQPDSMSTYAFSAASAKFDLSNALHKSLTSNFKACDTTKPMLTYQSHQQPKSFF